MEQMPWLDDFLASLLWSKRSLLIVSLCTVSSTEKWWLAEKCHLNLMFCRMWLKWSTILKYMPLTHVSACSSVRRWMQSTHILSYTQKWGGFLKVDHWLEFWIMITSRDSFKKQSPLAAHFSDIEWVQSLLVCVTYTTCTVNSICHFRRGQKLCKSQQIKWLHSRQTGNMGIMSEHWDLAHFKH